MRGGIAALTHHATPGPILGSPPRYLVFVPGERACDAPRVKRPVRYGGRCCVDGCGKKQVKGRVHCRRHLNQILRGESPWDDLLDVKSAQAPGPAYHWSLNRNRKGGKS